MNRKLFYVALLILLSGCATYPGLKDFPYATQTINQAPYFPLINMCTEEGVEWDYDPLSRVIILKKDSTKLELLIDSNKALLSGMPIELKSPVILKDSLIMAPVEVRSYFFPSPSEKAAPPAEKKEGVFLREVRTVVIDPGHGGKDPGAIGRGGLQEKEVVLDVSRRVKKELEKRGLKVYLTRDDDRFIALNQRPKAADRRKADIFVSIHANANHSRRIEGFEVYYLSDSVDDEARARASAENAPLELEEANFLESFSVKAILWDMIHTENRRESIELASMLGSVVSRQMDLKMLGCKGAAFVVLKGSSVPSVLVEMGYISNQEGERKLRDLSYRQKMAEAICDGIMKFKGFVENCPER